MDKELKAIHESNACPNFYNGSCRYDELCVCNHKKPIMRFRIYFRTASQWLAVCYFPINADAGVCVCKSHKQCTRFVSWDAEIKTEMPIPIGVHFANRL